MTTQDKIKEFNFIIEPKKGVVSIEISTNIFPMSVIMRSAYHFIDDVDVVVNDGVSGKVIVTLVPHKNNLDKKGLKKLGFEFNIQLISSFLEDLQARRYENIRNAMMVAALAPTRSQRNVNRKQEGDSQSC